MTRFSKGTGAGAAVAAALAVLAAASAGPVAASEALAGQKLCLNCHKIADKQVGPPFKAVAARYANDKGAVEALSAAQRQRVQVLFATLDPDRDALAMLKSIIGQMGRHIDRLNDTERGLIDNAVNREWEQHGRNGSIDGVIAILNEIGTPQAEDLATAMFPFSSRGTYGRFFIGEATVDMSAAMTVFELSDLSSREELRSVVLTAIMFLSSQTMRRIDRQIPKALLIDEAWQMLRGGSMADFVETYSRTCRKYGASLITATQSLNDYYKSEGSLAALENSDWSVILQQKAETISDFQKHDRFDMDPYTESLLRSLKRNGVEYSDIMIKGPDTLAVGRLVLDPFSATLYSSSPVTFGQIEQLIEDGFTMDEAIERVAFPEAQHGYALEAAE